MRGLPAGRGRTRNGVHHSNAGGRAGPLGICPLWLGRPAGDNGAVHGRDPVWLERGRLRAAVLPWAGGSLAELSQGEEGGRRWQLLRPAPPPWHDADPERAACFPLVPWSNRVSAGGFATPAGRVVLEPNRRGEPFPIHGDGWLLPWEVERRGSERVALALDRSRSAPYAYRAGLDYALLPNGLRMRLSVTHQGAAPMPYGLGFHPWFPYQPGFRLRAAARGMWEETDNHLPGPLAAVPEDLRLGGDGPLPDRWMNNAFRGWDGVAELAWPAGGRRLRLRCDNAAYFVLYHPPGASFVCFEPVTHPVDAFHLPSPHRGEGLRWLTRGETVAVTCELTVPG